MKITVARDCRVQWGTRMVSQIRVGDKKLLLIPDRAARYDYCCEGDSLPDLALIKKISGADLPNRVLIPAEITDERYPYISFAWLVRNGKAVHFDLVCRYEFETWNEVVSLNWFHRSFVRSLRQAHRGAIEIENRISSDLYHTTLRIQSPASGSLSDCYDRMVRTLASQHKRVVHEIIASARSAPPSGRRQRPMAFICHDSRDKDHVARPIAAGLAKLMCPVWYDEFSLSVGDHLRESIERGLREARKCILILSPRFFRNRGWTKFEFDSVFSRELIRGKNVILPVWAGVTPEDVLAYSPSLANRLGVNWKLGAKEVIRQLYRAIHGLNGD